MGESLVDEGRHVSGDDSLGTAPVKGDTAALGRLLSDQFTFTNSRGEVQTKAQALSDLKSGAVKYEELKRDDLKVRFFGDTAIATARVTLRGQRNGQWG